MKERLILFCMLLLCGIGVSRAQSGITNSYNHAQAEDALRSAAYTYVVAALGSLATLIYYIMIFMGRRD
mgnify:CR=1 FL=1